MVYSLGEKGHVHALFLGAKSYQKIKTPLEKGCLFLSFLIYIERETEKRRRCAVTGGKGWKRVAVVNHVISLSGYLPNSPCVSIRIEFEVLAINSISSHSL